ncbi:DUF2092 domain-containing protein [Brevundimonas sp. Root1279]|uniref:DUF2092 domain-containing protein n=1 Tax=Brevundimonas sp. Root1279 TaxID=1736443 RepID=UPI0006F8159A|nr:DUF2092 domain-containing protein [Brevundimonas sp. Root1279]KQW78782.1 hypothetical protein ASC65_15830 [Brevundimonas sp. Root1279]
MHASLPALAFAFALGAAPTVASPQATPATATPSQVDPAAASAPTNPVSPDAVQALHRMGAYLGTLVSFEITAETSRELMLGADQKFDLDGVATYRVRRPNALFVENTTPRKQRRFIYDGQHFTVYAPSRSYYATVDAPPTIGELLNLAAERYGVELPLEDLFHWGDPANLPQNLEFAAHVGTAMINGVQTDQYIFRQPEMDWQIWIQQGSEPLPRKIAIIDRTDPTLPKFSATLDWNLSPTFDARTFAFAPDADDKAIQFREAQEAQ